MIKTTVGIEGMSCGMCEAHVNETIRKGFQVKSVKASHTKKSAEIISEKEIDETALRSAIDATGYKVTSFRSEEYKSEGFFRKLFG